MLLSASVVFSLILIYILNKFLRRGSQQRRSRSSTTISHGFTNRAFRNLRLAYEASCKRYESTSSGGSSLAVFHHGQLVADMWSGVADTSSGSEWNRWTEANAYSCSNFLAGVCLARLVAQGHLDYSKPVSHYWPEFAANGKAGVTVHQLLCQAAGLAGLDNPIDAPVQLARGKSQDVVNATLAEQAPLWPVEPANDTSILADNPKVFHYWTWGLYADALLQRVDPKARRLADYFREEIAEPYGLRIRIGSASTAASTRLAHQRHVKVQLARPTPNWTLVWRCLVRPEYWPSLRRLLSAALSSLRLLNRPTDKIRRLASNACRGAMDGSSDLPSTVGGAVGTTESFARLLSLLCSGKIVPDRNCVKKLAWPATRMPDENPNCGCRLAIGPGSMPLKLDEDVRQEDGWLIGCLGYGGQFLYCDLDRQLCVAFLTNSLSPMSFGDDPRCRELLKAAMDCCDRG